MDLRRLTLILLASLAPAFAQVENVRKHPATDRLTESLKVPNGLSLTVEAGGSLSLSGVVSGTPTGGVLNLSNMTLFFPSASIVGSAQITDGAIVNADINASAAIALSKLATDPLARANHTGAQTLSTISDAGTLATWASLTPSANGQSLVTAADYAAMKALLDLETGTDVQAFDAQLGSLAGLSYTGNALKTIRVNAGETGFELAAGSGSGDLLSTNNLSDVANAATARTNLGLAIGTNVQAYDADLTTWAGVTPGANVATFLATPSFSNLNAALTGDDAAGLAANNLFTGANRFETSIEPLVVSTGIEEDPGVHEKQSSLIVGAISTYLQSQEIIGGTIARVALDPFGYTTLTQNVLNVGGATTSATVNLNDGAVLRFLEPQAGGMNYTEIKAQAQSADINYVWPATIGTTGQVLAGTVSGTTRTLEWEDTITLGTEQATTSGSTKDFTDIPAGVKRITIMFDGVSLTSTGEPLVQIGDSGGVETSGYTSVSTVNASSSSSTAGFILRALAASHVIREGTLVLTRMSGNKWVATGTFTRSDLTIVGNAAGIKTLSAELDRVRITTVSGDFDAGAVNILYE